MQIHKLNSSNISDTDYAIIEMLSNAQITKVSRLITNELAEDANEEVNLIMLKMGMLE